MKRIEVLFPEICNMFGNMYNVKYLEKTSKEIEVIYTSLSDEPKFLTEDISMVYMAPMTEKSQEIVIKKLKPYTEQISKKINENQLFLVIGNAMEVFGQYIENEDGSKIEALGLTSLYAKRDMMHRYNSLFLGEFVDDKNNKNEDENKEKEENKIQIVGFKSQFACSFGDNEKNYLFNVIKGSGINKESTMEGIRINNFIGTYVLGPILIMNPDFTKYILELMNIEDYNLIFDEELYKAYQIRLNEFNNLEF